MSKDELNLLLVQVRDDDILHQEFACYMDKIDLAHHQVSRLDVFNDALHPERLGEVDGVIFAGAGAYNIALKDLHVQDELINLAREAVKWDVPTLGICYGAHVMAEALGGTVERDPSRAEVGTYDIHLDDVADDCPVFSDYSKTFAAQQGHKDHVTKLPGGAKLLGRSELSENQIWTMPGKKAYAVQFHPEMNDKEVIERIAFYEKMYVGEDTSFDAIRESTRPGPEATQVIPDFIHQVVLGGKTYPKQN